MLHFLLVWQHFLLAMANGHAFTQVKIDGPIQARYFDGPVTGLLWAHYDRPLQARQNNGSVTGLQVVTGPL